MSKRKDTSSKSIPVVSTSTPAGWLGTELFSNKSPPPGLGIACEANVEPWLSRSIGAAAAAARCAFTGAHGHCVSWGSLQVSLKNLNAYLLGRAILRL